MTKELNRIIVTTPEGKFVFRPREDITTYELAHIMAYILMPATQQFTRRELFSQAMDAPGIRRHFEEATTDN